MERDRFSESDNESVKNDNEEPEVKNQSNIDNLADSSEVDTGAGVKFPSNEAVASSNYPTHTVLHTLERAPQKNSNIGNNQCTKKTSVTYDSESEEDQSY